MTRLYLLRHGAVETEDTFYGQSEVPLCATGRRQLEEAARLLSPLHLLAVHTSDLGRAVESARLIAAGHDLEPIREPAFREMHLGVLEGLDRAEARRRHPDLAQMRYQDMWRFRFPGGGESVEDVATRVRPALASLLEAYPGRDDDVVLVAHNSVNRVILGDALGLPLDRVFGFAQDFGRINRIDYAPQRTRVVFVNWTPRPFD